MNKYNNHLGDECGTVSQTLLNCVYVFVLNINVYN